MTRKRVNNPEELLSHNLIIRVNESTYNRLENLRKDSSNLSIAAVARDILSNRRIKCFYKDITMNAPMEELVLIRKELKAIGVNINQQTKQFDTSESEVQRAFHAMKTAELYKKFGDKTDSLLIIVSKLAEKWLSRS